MNVGLVKFEARAVGFGFRIRARGLLTRGEGDCVGWLGLNTASRAGRAGEVTVNPVVGVRYNKIETLVAAGLGTKPVRWSPPSFSEPLRYLVPTHARRDWTIDGSPDDMDVVEDFAHALRTFGTPMIEELSQLEPLITRLERRAAQDQQAAERLPVALLLAGRKGDAIASTEMIRASLVTRADAAAKVMAAYLDWLTSYIKGLD